MLRRLLIGLVKGLLIGGILTAVLIKGFGVAVFGALVAYLAAVVAGAVTGLVAGKPFWAKEARIEVTLKAVVGAAIATASMFALRKWVPTELDLSALGAGAGQLGALPAASLPLITTFLAVVFELDNTNEVPATDERAALAPPKQRVPGAEGELAELKDEELNQADYSQSQRKR
jgi:hypothetical protein